VIPSRDDTVKGNRINTYDHIGCTKVDIYKRTTNTTQTLTLLTMLFPWKTLFVTVVPLVQGLVESDYPPPITPCSTNGDCLQRGLPVLKPRRRFRARQSPGISGYAFSEVYTTPGTLCTSAKLMLRRLYFLRTLFRHVLFFGIWCTRRVYYVSLPPRSR
jgi:hypothetical protein